MNEIRFASWRDFQSVCRFWMQHLVNRVMQRSVTYYVYGNDGQGQGGVDLVSGDPTLGVVGQSKCWNTKILTWNSIQEELRKTHDFPGLIDVYVILTTAPRHTSVQQFMPGDKCDYEEGGRKFKVRIYYWDDLKDLDFIPRTLLQQIFPRLFSLAAPVPPVVSSRIEYSQSLQFSRTFLPTYISPEHLHWVATWDFSKGYVPSEKFDYFSDFNIELDRMRHGMKKDALQNWLNVGDRNQLSFCLPAADPLFMAIQNFADAVNGNTVSNYVQGVGKVYAHGNTNVGSAARIENNWKVHANTILVAYREIICGESPSY